MRGRQLQVTQTTLQQIRNRRLEAAKAERVIQCRADEPSPEIRLHVRNIVQGVSHLTTPMTRQVLNAMMTEVVSNQRWGLLTTRSAKPELRADHVAALSRLPRWRFRIVYLQQVLNGLRQESVRRGISAMAKDEFYREALREYVEHQKLLYRFSLKHNRWLKFGDSRRTPAERLNKGLGTAIDKVLKIAECSPDLILGSNLRPTTQVISDALKGGVVEALASTSPSFVVALLRVSVECNEACFSGEIHDVEENAKHGPLLTNYSAIRDPELKLRTFQDWHPLSAWYSRKRLSVYKIRSSDASERYEIWPSPDIADEKDPLTGRSLRDLAIEVRHCPALDEDSVSDMQEIIGAIFNHEELFGFALEHPTSLMIEKQCVELNSPMSFDVLFGRTNEKSSDFKLLR